MYEFLDEGIKYEDLNIFQKHKADWLEESNKYSKRTKRSYWINLNTKVNFMEVNKNKELYNWDKEEITQLIKNTATKKENSKTTLFSTISRYIDWAYKKGLNFVGNPCDSIDKRNLFDINELAIKESYQKLDKFFNFISGLECSDVDRAMLTLLRYGVSVEDVGNVKWDDIDREEKILNVYREDTILQLPIDNLFLMFIDKAKQCQTRMSNKREVEYLDYGYIVKSTIDVDWQHMPYIGVYNRVGQISRDNQIIRISIPELNVSRKYDILLDRFDDKGELDTIDMNDVLLQFDGVANANKRNTLRKEFEKISGIEVKARRDKRFSNNNLELVEV